MLAAAWYKKAADQNYTEAQYQLGVCYEIGLGVPEDKAKAVMWYKKAGAEGKVRELESGE